MTDQSVLKQIGSKLDKLIELITRAVPPLTAEVNFDEADAFVWHTSPNHLVPVSDINRIAIDLLCGIDRNRDLVIENTQRFAQGYPANNVLLWGARGMGKSSLIKASHAEVNSLLTKNNSSKPLKLIEIHREDIESLPVLLKLLRNATFRFLLFCDDLSFDNHDTSYKSLKAILDGGIEGRPENVLFYATSNRRHLMPRDMMENERSTAINPSESVEEKVSLSDRFGLWIGFHNCSQDDYLAMVQGYVEYYNLKISLDELRAESLEWSVTRGARSGRVAFQYIQDLAGRLGQKLIQTG